MNNILPTAKLYLFATFAKTLDEHHIKNNKIHLIFSTFYTKNDLTKNLNIKELNYNLLLLRVSLKQDFEIKIINHSNLFVEINCSYLNFIKFKDVDEFINFIENLTGNQNEKLKKIDNVLFIFENMN